jgi:hypothetical protein
MRPGRAEDVIESMLISVDEPYWNSSVAASMSQTYLQHFELVTKGGDVPGAFHVLERVRGRTLAWALEDRKAFPTADSGQTASLETDVAGLQIQGLGVFYAVQAGATAELAIGFERHP